MVENNNIRRFPHEKKATFTFSSLLKSNAVRPEKRKFLNRKSFLGIYPFVWLKV